MELRNILNAFSATARGIIGRSGYQEITERGYLLISLVSLICTFACFAWMSITIPLIMNTTSELERMASNKISKYCNATTLREDTRMRVSASSREMSLGNEKESSPSLVDRSGRQLNSPPNTFVPYPLPNQRPDQSGYVTIQPTVGCCKPGPPGAKGKTGNNGKSGRPGSPGRPGKPGRAAPEKAKCKVQLPCNCPVGPPGPPGVRGSKGYGPRGPPGADGRDGILGSCGRKGAPGDKGILGQLGEVGDPGTNVIGETPVPGSPGLPGIPGPVGPPGERGSTGMTVVKIGPPGKKGASGRAGDDGRAGLPGPVGDPGKSGEEGVCPHYCNVDGGVFYFDLKAQLGSTSI